MFGVLTYVISYASGVYDYAISPPAGLGKCTFPVDGIPVSRPAPPSGVFQEFWSAFWSGFLDSAQGADDFT